MSFDLFLVHFQHEDSAPANREEVYKLLRRHAGASLDKFESHCVEFDDGGRAEFNAEGVDSDPAFSTCSFNVRSFTPEMMAFIHAVAVAGDMTIVNMQGANTAENPTMIVVAEHQRPHLPKDDPENAVLVESGPALSLVLGVGMSEQQDYRERVVGTLPKLRTDRDLPQHIDLAALVDAPHQVSVLATSRRSGSVAHEHDQVGLRLQGLPKPRCRPVPLEPAG